MSVRVLAKSLIDENPVYLSEHIRDVLTSFNLLFSTKWQDIEIKNKNLIKRCIELAIICHDFGKVNPAFQIISLGNHNFKPFYVHYKSIPHSILSIFFINDNFLESELKKYINNSEKEELDFYIKLIKSSVAFHHWRNNFDKLVFNVYDDNYNNLKDFFYFLKNNQDITTELENILKNEIIGFISQDIIKFNYNMADSIINDVPLVYFLIPPFKEYFLPVHFDIKEKNYEKENIFIKGNLIRCDNYASFCEEDKKDVKFIEIINEKEHLKEEILKVIRRKCNNEQLETIWQIEELKNKTDKNIILLAPTGFGKTEFAFLWAENRKLFYTLPLKVATNQIYDRAKKVFGESVGLLHSDSDIHIMMNHEFENSDPTFVYEFSKQLSFHRNFATGDQIFPYSLKFPCYEKFYSIIPYSYFVIDEIQSYNPKSMAVIVKMLSDIERLSGKFLLMTATLPNFVKEKLNNFEIVNVYENYKENLKKLTKHKVKFEYYNNEKNLKKILKQAIIYAKQGKRILVIANTIKQAKKFYKILCEESDQNMKIFLLHSEFTFNQRKEKENKEIEKEFGNPKNKDENIGKILVSTQIIEASLDIDADILFTEFSPLDSFFQRMGRIVRRIKFDPLTKKYYEYFEDDKGKIFSQLFEKNCGIEPNIFVLLNNDISSGINNFIYDKEITYLSLATLIGFELFENLNPKKIKKALVDILKKNNHAIEISEFEKYELLEKMFCDLDKFKNNNYLNQFEESLNRLDVGFSVSTKNEAFKFFRDISSISVIPINLFDFFKEKLKKFFEKTHVDYVNFKAEILYEFTVNVSLYKFVENGKLKDAVNIAKILNDFLFDIFDEKSKRKILNWTGNIYLVPTKYDNQLGLLTEEKDYEKFNEIINEMFFI